MVREGDFREDLFYRLNVGVIDLPPLRDRLEDLELLWEHFLTQFARRFALDKPSISAGAMQAMRGYHWPGNVRELCNVLERASIMANGSEIQLEHLPADLRRQAEIIDEEDDDVSPLDLSLEAAERDQIRRALDSAGGRRVAAARLLGLSRRTLYRKLDKYGIR